MKKLSQKEIEQNWQAMKDFLSTCDIDVDNGNTMLFNVHGVYKPGNVKLRPKVLRDGQEALKAKYGEDRRFRFVFHGGSGSGKEEIQETLLYGVVKMNIDTDTQYAFTRPIADHIFKNYDGICVPLILT